MEFLSSLLLPLTVAGAGALMLWDRTGKKGYFSAFLEGAREGLHNAIGLIPTLVALIVAVKMLSASGFTDLLSSLLAPAANAIGLPSELLPLLLTRPFSGSASLAAFSELLGEVGADSFPGLCASVIMGSSDTFLYIITVYFSHAGVRRSRYAIPAAVAVMLFSVFFSCFLCRLQYK